MAKNTAGQEIGNGKQIIFLVAGKLSALIVTFLVPVVLTRTLTKDNYGYYAQFNNIAAFLITIFSFSFQSNLYYFFPRKEKHEHKALIGNSMVTLECGALLACLLLLIPPFGELITGGGVLYEYLPYLCAYILLFMPIELMEPFYVLIKDYRTSLWYPPLVMVSRTLFVVGGVLIFENLFGVFCGLNLKNALLLIVTLLYISWQFEKHGMQGRFTDWTLFKEQLKYVAPAAMAAILFTLAKRFDKLVCISFLTPAQYASYAVAFFGVPGLNEIFNSIGQVYLVSMSKSYAAGDKAGALRILQDRSCIIYSLAFPLLLGICLYANQLVEFIFTAKYLDSVGYFRVYLVTFCFAVLGAGVIIKASGHTMYTMWSYAISAAFSLPATYFLVKYYGPWGGIAGVVFAQFLPKSFQIFFEIRILETSLRKYLPWKRFAKISLFSLLFLLPFALQNHLFPLNIWFSCGMGMMYLSLVFIWEIRNGLFMTSKNKVSSLLRKYHLSALICLIN